MRVMIIADKAFDDERLIQASIITCNVTLRKHSKGKPMTLVQGGDMLANKLAAEAATALGWKVEKYSASQFTEMLTRARHNVRLLESDVDVLITFQKESSKTVEHAIQTAMKMHIPVKIHREGREVA